MEKSSSNTKDDKKKHQ